MQGVGSRPAQDAWQIANHLFAKERARCNPPDDAIF